MVPFILGGAAMATAAVASVIGFKAAKKETPFDNSPQTNPTMNALALVGTAFIGWQIYKRAK